MTDPELLELVRSTPVAALTDAELAALRDGLAQSAALREFLRSRLRWQQYSAELVERIECELPAASPPGSGSRRSRVRWAAAALLIAVLAVGTSIVWVNRGVEQHRQPEFADAKSSAEEKDLGDPTDAGLRTIKPPAAGSPQPPAESVAPPAKSPLTETELTASGPLPNFAAVCFSTFEEASRTDVEHLREWFDPVAASSAWFSERTRFGTCAGLAGVYRLKPAWPESGLLRIRLASASPVEIHCFAAGQGATLVYDSAAVVAWSGYTSVREPAAAEPHSRTLAATSSRLGPRRPEEDHETVELHYADGGLWLAQGDHPLLSVPLAMRPEAVFVQGRALILGIAAIDFSGELPSQFTQSSVRDSSGTGGSQGPWPNDNSPDLLSPRPFSRVRHLLLDRGWPQTSSPVANQLITAELLQLLNDNEWKALLNFCEMLHYYGHDRHDGIVSWAISRALRELSDVEPFAPQRQRSWREMLVEEAHPSLYRSEAELRAEIAADRWDEAARRIAQLSLDRLPGYAAVPDEEQLMMSLPARIDDLFSQYPELADAAASSQADDALLRAEQAIANADAVLAEAVATQFAGTEGAARADLWLAQRALAAGWRAAAEWYYTRSTEHVSGEGRDAISVQAADLRAEQEEFAALLSAAQGPLPAANLLAGQPTTPAGSRRPALEENRVAAELDLGAPLGLFPSRATLAAVADFAIDWPGRQMGIAFRKQTVYFSNRFQLLAADAVTGRRLWQAVPATGKPGLAQDWPLIPMRPVVYGEIVVGRLVYGPGLTLIGCERNDGSVRWLREAAAGSEWVSDPWQLQGQLCCLRTVPGNLSQLVLELVHLDPATGMPLVAIPLITVREHWRARRICQVGVMEESFVAVLGGIVGCFSTDGRVRWLRRSVVVPPESEPRWVEQEFQPPHLAGDRIVVAEPGGWSVSCLKRSTGRRLWQHVLPGMHSVVAVGDDRVVVRESDAIRAFELSSGAPCWQVDASDTRLPAAAADPAARFVAVGHEPEGPSLLAAQMIDLSRETIVQLSRIELSSGEVIDTARFPIRGAMPQTVGLLRVAGSRIWLVHGQRGDANRTLKLISSP